VSYAARPESTLEQPDAEVGAEGSRRGPQGFVRSTADTLLVLGTRRGARDVLAEIDREHRRISLLHLRGVPGARIAEFVGQRNLTTTANTYSHVLIGEAEVDYADLLNVR
jgi:hypothetical protein